MLKKILFVNLKKETFEVKAMPELDKYIGGLGIGLKLLQEYADQDPVIFSIGPLNGFFPFASKTSIIFQHEGVVEDIYVGGTLSSRIRFSGLDSIVLLNKSEKPQVLDITDENVTFRSTEVDPNNLGLPGKRSVIKPVLDKFVLDSYFETPEKLLEEKLVKKNVRGMVVTGTKVYEVVNRERYEELYTKILSRTNEVTVEKASNPSCAGCPVGCKHSKVGEIGGNVLVHSLVGCAFSENIYSNIGIVFSCLNILGYDYTHEDIEALPVLINDLLKELA